MLFENVEHGAVMARAANLPYSTPFAILCPIELPVVLNPATRRTPSLLHTANSGVRLFYQYALRYP